MVTARSLAVLAAGFGNPLGGRGERQADHHVVGVQSNQYGGDVMTAT
jgi:hypothetical protein